MPLLEEGESKRHRPNSALALAECYAKLGDLLRASELFHAIAAEKPGRKYGWWDNAAIKRAAAKAKAVDERIPTLTLEIEELYGALEIEIDGRPVEDTTQPIKIPPDRPVALVARATGRQDLKEEVTLHEGERRVMKLRLLALPPPPPRKPPGDPEESDVSPHPEPRLWIGGGYQGFIVPWFMFGFFGDGGRTMLVPGGTVSLGFKTSAIDITVAASYASFRLGETPFKPAGSPDTDYEIIESDLQALLASVHVAWDLPLDARGRFHLRIGGGLGLGWAFTGDLYRSQAYPLPGAANDLARWKRCRGPNNPEGTFLYCNQLDHDADRYPGYTEPSWFAGGYRPTFFPYLALPEIGLAIHPSPKIAIDFTVGASLTGLLTRAGVRFGL
ncbi:hypothetical protein [Chondromyces crocatus]|uniref:hypothetical protein n=1 Tax=Chondromyces crocatus TaxID=52 RepID=UPI00067D33A7|nr:hypothetical protein [Chondromyces crocatus]